jgi:hypothetical protein
LLSKISYLKYHFVSLIGEAASGTFLPFLGYLEKFGAPLSVSLIFTPQVADLYPVLESRMAQLTPPIPIKGYEVASSKEEAVRGLKTVETIFVQLEDSLGPLAINMMAGMKKTSLAGLLALKRTDHVFIQLSEQKFIISRLVAGTVHTESTSLTQKLTTKQYLDLLAIDYHFYHDPPWDLEKLCHQHQVRVPSGALFNVVIDRRRFDCVWTESNTLCLLFVHQADWHDGPKALAEARAIEILAGTKCWTNGLFNRRIYVFENLGYNVERFNYEVGGLVKAYKVDWKSDRLSEETKGYLNEVFRSQAPASAPQILHKPNLNPLAVPILITSLGRLSEATILALSSHRLPQAVLLYTPEDEWVAHLAELYRKKAAELGLKKIHVLATDFTAANVHAHLPVELAQWAQVNLTPGTKPQGTALGLWAKNHRVAAWIIDGHVLKRLGDVNEEKPVIGPGLRTTLDFLLEVPVTNYGWNHSAPDWNDPFYSNMFRFMNLIVKRDQKDLFFRSNLEAEGLALINDSVTNVWRFHWPGGNQRVLKDGQWYEKLTAKAFEALNLPTGGYYEVACGVEVSIPGRTRLSNRTRRPGRHYRWAIVHDFLQDFPKPKKNSPPKIPRRGFGHGQNPGPLYRPDALYHDCRPSPPRRRGL